MSEKASKLNLISSTKPQLATNYEHAQKRVFYYDYVVIKSYYSKFRVAEDDLRAAGIDTMDFAYTVTTTLEKWAKDKNLKFIPVQVFLGNWALSKFLKIYESKTVTILKPNKVDEVELLFSEDMVAQRYISENMNQKVGFSVAVKELEPFLSDKWLELYYANDRDWLRDIVLTRLCNLYRVHKDVTITSYRDLVDKLI